MRDFSLFIVGVNAGFGLCYLLVKFGRLQEIVEWVLDEDKP